MSPAPHLRRRTSVVEELPLAEELPAAEELPLAEELQARPCPSSVAPAPAASPVRARWRFPRGFWATLLVLVASAGLAGAAARGQQAELARHLVFDPNAGWTYTAVTNGFYNPRPAELALWAVGLLGFGLLVERNTGFRWTLLVVVGGSAGGVVGWWLFNTPDGLEIVNHEAGRVFIWLLDNRGPRDAFLFAENWQKLVQHLRWETPLAGSAGVCGALIGYAAVRRQLGTGDLAVRPIKFVLAVAYLVVLIGFAWPAWAGTPFPYAVLVGGLLGGVAMVVPEKAFNYVCEVVRDQMARKIHG